MQRDQQAWLVRFGELRYRAFSGAPVVEVTPAQWGLDPTTIRQAAHSRRYRETAPEQVMRVGLRGAALLCESFGGWGQLCEAPREAGRSSTNAQASVPAATTA